MRDVRRGEQGFVLVAVIVLLAILTIFGAGALLKSNIELKVSATSVESEQALAAANAGLNETFAYWSFDTLGKTELADITQAVTSGTASSGIYFAQDNVDQTDFPTPAAMSDLGGSLAEVDTFVRTTTGIRLYEISATGMNTISGNNWGIGNNPQVAIWATSFVSQTEPAYPYQTPNTASCENCSIVVYALGASGHARRLLREHMAVVQSGFGSSLGSITNAFQ